MLVFFNIASIKTANLTIRSIRSYAPKEPQLIMPVR